MTGTSTAPRSVLLDCDPGVDDALTLGLLLRSPEVELVGVSSVAGNTPAPLGAQNAQRLLALDGRDDVPVAVGAREHLTRPYTCTVQAIHGEDGLGGAADAVLPVASRSLEEVDGADLLIRLSHEHAGRLEVLAIGPLTNLAIALQRDPGLTERVARVTIMGGAALAPGNVTPVAEANIHDDPEAAAVVLAADWDTVLVGLDATMAQVLEESDVAALAASADPLPRALAAIVDHYLGFYTGLFGRRCCALHDPLAAALVVGLVRTVLAPAVPVSVDVTDGPGRGQTISDLRGRYRWPGWGSAEGARQALDVPGARCRVVLSTDRALAPLLVERLLG